MVFLLYLSLSFQQLVAYAHQAGFQGNAAYTIAQIAEAESGGNSQAANCGNTGDTCDRGVLQINSYWHSEVSDACAYDPACAFRAAYAISDQGNNFTPWVTYQNGSYSQYGYNERADTSPPSSAQVGACSVQPPAWLEARAEAGASEYYDWVYYSWYYAPDGTQVTDIKSYVGGSLQSDRTLCGSWIGYDGSTYSG